LGEKRIVDVEAIKKTREELLAARAQRQEEAAAVKETHELLLLELEDRFCMQLGKIGVAWAFANEDNSGEAGPIVVKLGETAAFKAFQAKDGASLENTFTFVSSAVVYPEKAVWNALALSRPALVYRACAALMKLFGTSKESFQAKL
jgi:hypothetical protein